MRPVVCIESVLLSILCLADMVSTLVFVSAGIAVERNPVMAACLHQSIWAFVVVKTFSFIPFLVVAEWYRRRNPLFARRAIRAAILLYVTTYVVLTARGNIC